MVLSVIAAVAGSLIALGSLALLWHQKVYIDAHTKEVTKIELPFGIKLQTNMPIIALVFLAVALIMVPVMKQKDVNEVALKGHVHATQPLKVYAIAAEQATNGDVLLRVPGNAYYTVIYLPANGPNAIDSQGVDLVKNHKQEFSLRDLNAEILAASNTIPAAPVHVEEPNVVAGFK